MVNRRRVTISIDTEVHRQSVEILKEAGVKFSSFVEIVAKGIIDSEQKTFNQMFQGMTERLVKEAASIKVRRK